MKKSLRLVGLFAVGALAVGAAGCSTKPEPDEIKLYYRGGPTEVKKFDNCIEPNTKGDAEYNNTIVTLPTSQRTWNIAKNGGDTNTPIESPTAQITTEDPTTKVKSTTPGPLVHVYMKTDFFLNTNCGDDGGIVRKFWENLGRRYKVNLEESNQVENWKNMMLQTIVPALDRSVRATTRQFTADQLVYDLDSTWTNMANKIGESFQKELKAIVGDDYFCGVTYQRGGECPKLNPSIIDIDFANQELQKSRDNVLKAQQDALAQLTAARAKVAEANELAKVSRNPQYLEFEKLERELEIAKLNLQAAQACATNPNCTLIVGVNGNVNVGAGNKS